METHLYLLLFPESLVISMLGPAEFGAYLATGTKKRAREQVMYFELDGGFESDFLDLEKAKKACVPHEDGRPKHSVYVSTYRVLEHVPLNVIGNLWLVTRDGRGLALRHCEPPGEYEGQYHLYNELCPVHPLIASHLNPQDYSDFITNPEVTVSVPRICFVEMDLADLAKEPSSGDAASLPYRNIDHIRDCLIELATKGKTTKTINRIQHEHIPYRCVKKGFFVGDQTGMLYYPFPSLKDMEKHHHYWWRSAELD
ncbi:MAG: hypothetical protein ACYTAO_16530 [Planctomycetota bacterium]|jgi:hypothetical protein